MVLLLLLVLELGNSSSIITEVTTENSLTPVNTYPGLSNLYIKGNFEKPSVSSYSVKISGDVCDIVRFDSSLIHCITPASDLTIQTTTTLVVEEDGVPVSFDTGVSSSLLFTPGTYTIYYIHPYEAAQGDKVYFVGLHDKDDVVNEAKVNGIDMNLLGTNTKHDPVFEYRTELGNNVHGDSYPTMKVNGKYVKFHWIGASYTLEGEEYYFKTIGKIDSISHNEGSIFGGLEITIQGRSFPSDTTRFRIEVSGVECNVTSASFNEVKCVNRFNYYQRSTQTVYEGSAGFKRDAHFNSGKEVHHMTSLAIPLHEDTNFQSEIYGLFKPPRTGKYRFFATSDDQCYVYLSPDENPPNPSTDKIIHWNSWIPTLSYFQTNNLESDYVDLQEGKLYYMKIVHKQGEGPSTFSIGVEMQNSTGSYLNTMPVMQRLNIPSNFDESYPFTWRTQKKQVTANFGCGEGWNKFVQTEFADNYFNIFSYCKDGKLFVHIPGYMYEYANDLVNFNLDDGSQTTGDQTRDFRPSNSQFWYFIPSDFLRTYHTSPQLRIWIDDRLIACEGDCTFEYKDPVIRGFSMSSGVVNIVGDFFPEDQSMLSVTLGTAVCGVTDNSETHIDCTFGNYTQGSWKPQVFIQDYGLVEIDSSVTNTIDLDCTSNCDVCSSSGFNKCLECSAGYYLVHSVCNSVCPTNYYCTPTHSQLTDSDFVFNLRPHNIQDIVTDLQSSIPVLTGKDNSFYPNYDSSDPWAAKDRGYYFTGSSYMQLPSPSLVLAPQFSLGMWVRPTSSTGTLLSKQADSSGVATEFCIRLNNYFPEVELESFLSATGSVDMNEGWNFLGVYFYLDSYFELEVYVNQTLSLALNSGTNWVDDLDSSFLFSIGAEHSDQVTLANFYEGFIWEVSVYNSQKSLNSMLEVTCEDCTECPLENSNECIPNCLIDWYWDGLECTECDPSCTKGCASSTTCNLCSDPLCEQCDVYEGGCLVCSAGAEGSPCVCKEGLGLDPFSPTCVPCDESLNRTAVENNCVCQEGFYNSDPLGIACVECTLECQHCSPVELNCVNCLPENSFQEASGDCACPSHSSLEKGQCVCEEGYYMESGPFCEECDSSCQTCKGPKETDCLSCKNSYLRKNGTCGDCEEGKYLQNNECFDCRNLCLACESKDVCVSCVQNAHLEKDSFCVCDEDYFQNATFCQKNHFYLDLQSKGNNLLELNFSKSLKEDLTKRNLSVSFENTYIYYSFEKRTNSVYWVSPYFQDKVEQGSLVELKIWNHQNLLSADNNTLFNQTFSVELSEHDPEGSEEDRGYSVGEALVIGAIVVAVCTSVISGSPSSLWSVLNTVQLLTYVPMTNNPLTPYLKGLFKGINFINFVPNVFGYFMDPQDSPNPHEQAEDYGIESNLFLLNASGSIGVLGLAIVGLPFIAILAECGFAVTKSKFKSLMKEYKYGVFLRVWVQGYLELAISAMLQVLHLASFSYSVYMSYMFAWLVLLLLVTSPPLITVFLRRRKQEIANLDQHSLIFQLWGSLIYEFRTEADSNAKYFHSAFLGRRLLYSVSLVYLSGLARVQAFLNLGLMVGFLLFMVVAWPYSEGIFQVFNTLTEIGICIVFGLIIFYVFPSAGHQQSLERIIFFVVLIIFCLQVLACILVFLKVTYKHYKTNKPRTNQPEEERKEPKRIVLDGSMVEDQSGEVFGRKLDFFRNNRGQPEESKTTRRAVLDGSTIRHQVA